MVGGRRKSREVDPGGGNSMLARTSAQLFLGQGYSGGQKGYLGGYHNFLLRKL